MLNSDIPAAARHGAVTVGNFDGVHLGHQRILETLKERAQRLKGPAVVVTFEPHPAALIRPDKVPPAITWSTHREQLLKHAGVDHVVILNTSHELLALSDRDFFELVLMGQLGANVIVEGPNFCFGRDRMGDIARLRELCRESSVELEIVPPFDAGQELISSSRIRELLRTGDVSRAARLLGRPHRLRGYVVHGDQRGATIGFPTANLAETQGLIPCAGVYAGKVAWQGKDYLAAINVGPNPTFQVSQQKTEVHLLDFQASLYDAWIEVTLEKRLREVRDFGSVDALCEQLQSDVSDVRRLLRI